MVSSAYATNIAGLTILGLQGWRFAFLSVAAVSALAGAAMWAFARDPRCSSSSWALDPHWLQDSNRAAAGTRSQSTRSHSSRQGAGVSKVSASAWGSVRKLITSPLAAEVWVVITTPSFIVVVVQVSLMVSADLALCRQPVAPLAPLFSKVSLWLFNWTTSAELQRSCDPLRMGDAALPACHAVLVALLQH